MNINNVIDLLHHQYAIITGGKSRGGCPLVTFPDHNNFHVLTDVEFQQLMLYLTSVPSLQEADLGFHLIIDRRNDRWNSIKAVLLKISMYFPGLIHVVYILKPTSFFHKTLSDVTNKLFKEEFKFQMIFLSSIEELHEYIDMRQLTIDLGGTLPYVHDEWIKQRLGLEKFSLLTHEISNKLDNFTKRINEIELPNSVASTQHLLDEQLLVYSELKQEILSATKNGEALLFEIKDKSQETATPFHNLDMGAVFAVERLLVQLEETEKTFDVFWLQYSSKLEHCLSLRKFEQDFKELRVNFNSHIKTVVEMTEAEGIVSKIDTFISEINGFEKLCSMDIQKAEEVILSGQQLMKIRSSCPLECIQPKCAELIRLRDILNDKMTARKQHLMKCKELTGQTERADEWCSNGVDILAAQKLETCATSELTEKYLLDIQQFVSSAGSFTVSKSKNEIEDSLTSEIESHAAQIQQKVEDVLHMCEKRIADLKHLATLYRKRTHTELSSELPKQPTGGAPYLNKAVLRKANTISKMENANEGDGHQEFCNHSSLHESDSCQNEEYRAKRGHVLAELLETEKVYVAELLSIIKGYKLEAQSEEMQPILPPGLISKLDIIFGNLEEIYAFHAGIFLKDLENCISSADLVALCFVQRRDTFYRLYSYYCQNIPRSEQIRETLVDATPFFQTCQRKLDHKLPLAAYLLKPVQRITKYQLLLKDLLKYCVDGKFNKELEQALECMLIVLKCVNDSMHQISITGFPLDLSQQGDLLLQGSFSVWAENKRDLRLRLKPMQRHIFLYQKAILFCKPASKTAHNKATYQFKHYLEMSQIGLTESVKGDMKKFEVWLKGRQEVYTIQAVSLEQKQAWVNEIKRVLLSQLEELKGEKIKQYSTRAHKQLRQTTSWDAEQTMSSNLHINNHRTVSCEMQHNASVDYESVECMEGGNWSSDCSNSDDEDQVNTVKTSCRYVALADYCAVGNSEVSMREGDMVELLKVGCAGWWFVKVIGSAVEGWAPAAYLENLHHKTLRNSNHSQDRLNDH